MREYGKHKDTAERIKALRAETGLTQHGFCDLVGINYNTYCAWEHGLNRMSDNTFRMIRRLLVAENHIPG